MAQVTYSTLNLRKGPERPPKTRSTEVDSPVVYADIRRQLPAEDPVPEVLKKSSAGCSNQILWRVLILITILFLATLLLCCALGYMGDHCPCKAEKDLKNIKKEICINTTGCRLCPYHWSLHEDQCYYLNVTETTWNQSWNDCKEMGADLLVIKDQEQQKFIQRFLRGQQTHELYWIGLHHDGDVWRWVDGEQYNSSLVNITDRSSGDCVLMNGSKYSQSKCMFAKRSICVKKSVRI